MCKEFAGRYGTVVILKTIIRASGGPGIPGAYRDRYLDRVTINTDPWKVALGIIRGQRGEVTYTYLYPPPPPVPPLSPVFRLLPVEAIQRK